MNRCVLIGLGRESASPDRDTSLSVRAAAGTLGLLSCLDKSWLFWVKVTSNQGRESGAWSLEEEN